MVLDEVVVKVAAVKSMIVIVDGNFTLPSHVRKHAARARRKLY